MMILVGCLSVGMVQAGELYRWTDADGKVHYTDQPPPASARKVEEKQMKTGGAGETSQLPYATQLAVRKAPVSLYVTDCGESCKLAREHLTRRGVPFTSKNPQTTPADAEALQKLIGGLYVPVLQVGSSVSKGYEKDAWDAALDAAGYPKSAVLKKAPAEATDGAPKSEPAAKPEPLHPWAGGR